jgi:5-methylcytosine-specific restriction endonuclease McrA
MGLDTETMLAIGWEDWIKLPIRQTDQAIQTVRGPVRVPTVVLCVAYAGRKEKRVKLSPRTVGERDGFTCQITGQYAPDGNVDHDLPRSRGGKDTWENLRWTRRDLNSKKGNRTLAEMGWKPIRPAKAPRPQMPEQWIKPNHPDWVRFLAM